MTALQGIDLYPQNETKVTSVKEQRKGEKVTSFNDYLAKKSSAHEDRENPRAEEAKESRPADEIDESRPERAVAAERAEEPVKSRPSAKKVATLLSLMPTEEGGAVRKLSKDTSKIPLKKGNSFQLDKSSNLSLGGKNESVENQVLLISRFLRGEISSEELESMSAADFDITKINEGDWDLESRELLRSYAAEESDKDKKVKGFLSDEGIVYYEAGELTGKPVNVSLNQNHNAQPVSKKGSENKLLMEVNVTDLREVAIEGSAETTELAVEHRIDRQSREQAEGEGFDDLLIQPAEKLLSAEGGGGKLQAPVTKEITNMFQRYLSEKGNGELVRKIDFLLKDNNAGEIKLILKPEALGNVRINLSLNENHIAGKIFVDNSSVRDIFLKNMDQFTSLLQDKGFEDAALEVWVGQEGNRENQSDQNQADEQDEKIRSVRGMKKLDESVPQTVVGDGSAQGEVNLVI